LEKGLLDGSLDVAILSRPPGSPLLDSIRSRDEDVVVIAAPDHPLAKKRSVPLDLLAQESFIVSKGSRNRRLIEDALAKKGLSLKITLEVDVLSGSRETFMTMAAKGLGLAVNNKSHVASDLKSGRLKMLNIPELNLKRAMHIGFRRNQQASSLIQEFIEVLKAGEQ